MVDLLDERVLESDHDSSDSEESRSDLELPELVSASAFSGFPLVRKTNELPSHTLYAEYLSVHREPV